MKIKELMKIILGRRYLDYRFSRLERMVMTTNQFNRNLELQSQGDKYSYYRRLHNLLYVMDVKDKEEQYIRVGKNNDGGYILLNLKDGRIAYSIGINKDVSWDKDMANLGYDIFMYDHTIKRLPEKNRKFHWSKIGIEGIHSCNKNFLTLEEMISINGHDNEEHMILKMDVEGHEWSVMENTSSDVLKKFDQIVIELHGLCGNQENAYVYTEKEHILRALENINKTHQLIHIHANNYNQLIDYCGNIMMPPTLEVTFAAQSQYRFKQNTRIFPTILDQPCDPRMPDIFLGTWN